MNEGARLPPALGPIAEVLALADSFALCIVTGPRDRRDSVYLRLTSSLSEEFELVRHRLDRDGLDFFDVLTGGDGIHPRVVFMSGLERMSDATRRDVTVRLNLLRDSWAPHPARVILWLPAWGLREFRKLAPDLFHWRSCLVPLHDADLPIGTETEYLVWACERYGGARESGPAPVDAIEIRRIADGHRTIYTGFSFMERNQVLRTVARYLAMVRLQAEGPADLDLTSRAGDVYQLEASPPLPLLLDAADLAGRLPPDLDWNIITRAAGIPLSAQGITLLDRANQEVLVLLEGIDRLDLSPGTPGGNLWEWLDRQRHLRVVAFVATYPPLPLLGWTRRRPLSEEIESSRASGAPPDVLLRRLLHDLFPRPSDVFLLMEHLFGAEVAQLLPAEPLDARTKLEGLLRRRALIDAGFFEQLKALRPAHSKLIDFVAREYLGAPAR